MKVHVETEQRDAALAMYVWAMQSWTAALLALEVQVQVQAWVTQARPSVVPA